MKDLHLVSRLRSDLHPTWEQNHRVQEKYNVTRKKQFDDPDNDEKVLLAEKAFDVNYFLVMIDVAKVSLKNRFEELKVFQNIIELRKCC